MDDLGESINGVFLHYQDAVKNRFTNKNRPAEIALRNARRLIDEWIGKIHPDLFSKLSVGITNYTPVWYISIHDRRASNSPKNGTYIVLLFDAKQRGFYLSISKASGLRYGNLGTNKSEELRKETEALRKYFEILRPGGFGTDEMNLSATKGPGLSYPSGSIFHKFYPKSEDGYPTLRNDIKSMGDAYLQAIENGHISRIESSTNERDAENENSSHQTAHFEMNTSTRLITSLASKPFVVLAGGTGTGKTRSAKLAAASLTETDNIEVVAVGADWTDNRPLLGFRNLLDQGGRTYIAPPALRMIVKALANPGTPHFLILDEMNLSHVERYFADFLSSMESKEPIKLHDCDKELKTEDGLTIDCKVAWPSNLFVIGTVNIDETTYMFSPKVLDRAHVIEFKVPWEEIEGGLEGAVPGELDPLTSSQVQEFMRITQAKDKALSEDDHEHLIHILRDMHEILEGSRFVFAHRTARECLNFVASTQSLSKADIIPNQDIKTVIDLAILQKALPKLNGAAGILSNILTELIRLCEKHGLPLCKHKLESMNRQLSSDQFVSFIQ